MKKLFLLAFSLPFFLTATEKEVPSKINSVTVFFQGAQVNRTANVTLNKGTYEVVLSDIENNVDNNSIQVRGKGDYLIKSFFTRRNYLQKVDYSDEIVNLYAQIKSIDFKSEDLSVEQGVLQDEQNLILTNQKLGGQDNGVNIEQLKQTSLFYQTRLKEIKLAILKINREKNELSKQRVKLQNQIKQLQSFKQESVNQLVVNIDVEKTTKVNLSLSYYVPNASWSPFYDVMIDEINKPINLVYKANVTQNTGVDWNNVDITLSTTQPNLSGQVPALSPFYLQLYNAQAYNKSNRTRTQTKSLNYQNVVGSGAMGNIFGTVIDAETGEPIPFASVVLKDANGNTVNGATTDMDGRFSVTVNQKVFSLEASSMGLSTQQIPINGNQISAVMFASSENLDEIEIRGARSGSDNYYIDGVKMEKDKSVYNSSTISQKATFFEYHISTPYTIISNNLAEVVHIREVEIGAHYEYQTVPKLDKDVFLIAQIFGWEEYNLLNGSARLYFEKTFVGESYLNVELTKDTMGLSLGRDKNIIVTRDKVLEESGVKTFSGNKKETRKFDIQVRNNKTAAIEVIVKDQYPLATDKKINVRLDESNEAKVTENYGYLEWKIPLAPSETVKKTFQYSVSYPAEFSLNIGE